MIEVKGLTKTFGTFTAVNDLSFTVPSGMVTGFLGPNGAGKSTTMRIILGLDRASSGQALIDGVEYASLTDPLRKVGALLDAKWVHPNRSARAHLRWMAASNGIADKRVDEVLELVGLTSVAKKKAGGFSLGMSQRLGLAGALLGDPDTLILDEPVNGLDPEGIRWIRDFLHRLAKEGRTILVSSHLLSEMAQTAEQLVVINRGRLQSETTVAGFVDSASESTVHVRSPQIEALRNIVESHGATTEVELDDTRPVLVITGMPIERIGELASENAVVLHELTAVHASLEDAFMKMTGDDGAYRAGTFNAAGGIDKPDYDDEAGAKQ